MEHHPVVAGGRALTIRRLAETTPAGSQIAVVGSFGPDLDEQFDRRMHTMEFTPTRRGTGADPDDGTGALDRLAIARARGATYFLLPSDHRWCLERYPELDHYLGHRAALVAGEDAGRLWELRPAPPPGEAKVFCIGLNKTGTSSLHLALQELGYRSHHWGGRDSYHAVLNAQRDGERLLHYVGEDHDSYSDIGPLSVRFDLADLQYPGSKFVLTTRDVDEWIDSRRRHAERNLRNQRTGAYEGSNLQVDEARWRAQWHKHIERVTAWFAGRDDLLMLDIAGGNGWEQLAPFLGHDAPSTPFPRENVDNASIQSHANTTTNAGGAPMRQRVKRAVKGGWRRVRAHLPQGVARAIANPSKRALRKLGLMQPPKRARRRAQGARV